jgi:hypothetical protein
MGDTFELKDDAARKGLAETIAWCAGLEIIADIEETEDARFQRDSSIAEATTYPCAERAQFQPVR